MGCLSSKNLSDVDMPTSQYGSQQPYAYQAYPCLQGSHDRGCNPNPRSCYFGSGRSSYTYAAPYHCEVPNAGTSSRGQRADYGKHSSAGNCSGYGRMALAAAGGIGAGAGAVYMFDPAGGIAGGFGDAASFLGRDAEGFGDFAGDSMEDFSEFVGGGFQELGRLF